MSRRACDFGHSGAGGDQFGGLFGADECGDEVVEGGAGADFVVRVRRGRADFPVGEKLASEAFAEDEQLDGFVRNWAERLAAGPPLALSMTKTMLNNSVNISMEQALEEETRSQAVNFGTADTSEAISAFIEKRDPEFKGR